MLLREERHTSPAATWAKMLTTKPTELRIPSTERGCFHRLLR